LADGAAEGDAGGDGLGDGDGAGEGLAEAETLAGGEGLVAGLVALAILPDDESHAARRRRLSSATPRMPMKRVAGRGVTR
jgi:hypothetical protein